ncbi:CKLF-like MARVEL transmembrane domain-containing protein 5 [Latimeria chalumnae]|uniref:CKLF-like MARVEL transmembrane domain-containing protein 5 n=1 Tax=Latimeria chalumnae TaxID=7897 RepID=UPI00313BF95B
MYEAEPTETAAKESSTFRSFSLDKEFLRTKKGMLLAAELILTLLIFICFAASTASYLAAPLLEFLITLAFLFLYMTKYYERFKGLNWPCTDFLRCVSAIIIFLVVSISAAVKGGEGGTTAGAVFGFFILGVFVYDAFVIYKSVAGQNFPNTQEVAGSQSSNLDAE